MMSKFSEGNYAPISEEGEFINISNITGEVPIELNGALYRNGPNPQFPNNANHWFEGDGMLHKFRIYDRKVDYCNRWILTERFETERRAGKSLFEYFGSKSEVKIENYGTANTNIILHANKLFALQENSPAIEINQKDLSTMGSWNYENKVPQTSAHPHFDYETGEMHNFAYSTSSTEIIYYAFDKAGNLYNSQKFNGPYSCMMHDFFITKNYVLFLFLPLTINKERIQSGKLIMWEPELGSHIAIMPRNGTAKDIIWFNTDSFYAFHCMNAYEDNNTIILDLMKSSRANLFPDKTGEIPDKSKNFSCLNRLTFDLERRRISKTKLDSISAEFPRFDERYTGLHYRHGFVAANIYKGLVDNFNAIIHYDLKNNSHKICDLGRHNIPSEPIFVPRQKNSPEGDGFILTVVYKADKNNSELYILDAMNIDKKPLAIIHLPHRVPNGFHGNWY